MRAAPLSPTAFAARQLLGLLAIALAVALAGMASAAPSDAGTTADTRAHLTLSSFLDEPTLAFAGQPVEVVAAFGVPAGAGRQPTGGVELSTDQPGAEPQNTVLLGNEVDVRFSITPATAGRHCYTVRYAGDTAFQPLGQQFCYDVWTGPETRTTLVAGASGPLTVTEPVTLTATVVAADGQALTGDPDGPVAFYADGVRIGEGTPLDGSRGWKAELTLSFLPIGRHRITALHESALRYSGPESAAVTVDVAAPANGAPVAASQSVSQDADAGEWTHSTAAVTAAPGALPGVPAPTGYVQFYVDGTSPGLPVPLAAGAARYDWLPLAPGDHTFRAVYQGDTVHLPAELPQQHLLVPAPAG
jgi:hypothetical protein